MTDIKDKILYCLALIVLLFIGIGVGYVKTASFDGVKIKNSSVLEFARDYNLVPSKDIAITASTKTYDINVVYEDSYTVCKESITNSKVEYGSTMDKVKEQEKKYQEENGLLYTIKEETENKIVYIRTINENCPNHFKVIFENNKINIYSIQGENRKTLYMSIDDINLENLRDELKQKVEKGTFINSREELNNFIEDLES